MNNNHEHNASELSYLIKHTPMYLIILYIIYNSFAQIMIKYFSKYAYILLVSLLILLQNGQHNVR